MRTRMLAASIAAVVLAASSARAQQQPPGFWITPAIPGIGPVHVWPQAVMRPDANVTYKAVFDVTKAAESPDKVNPGLDHAARAVNVFAAAGVPLDHMDFTVIIHGPATPAALDAKTFEAKFGKPNPNLAVIDGLTKAGVHVYVCGNALGDFKYEPSEVNPKLKVAFSALALVIMLQNQGYAVLAM